MKPLNHKEVEELFLNQLGQKVRAEDYSYVIRPISWYWKEPFLGLKRYPYIKEKCDCDNRCTILKKEWLDRHLKTKSAEALPVFMVKARMNNITGDNKNHWFMAVVVDEGVGLNIRFLERVEKHIVIVSAHTIDEIYRIHI